MKLSGRIFAAIILFFAPALLFAQVSDKGKSIEHRWFLGFGTMVGLHQLSWEQPEPASLPQSGYWDFADRGQKVRPGGGVSGVLAYMNHSLVFRAEMGVRSYAWHTAYNYQYDARSGSTPFGFDLDIEQRHIGLEGFFKPKLGLYLGDRVKWMLLAGPEVAVDFGGKIDSEVINNEPSIEGSEQAASSFAGEFQTVGQESFGWTISLGVVIPLKKGFLENYVEFYRGFSAYSPAPERYANRLSLGASWLFGR